MLPRVQDTSPGRLAGYMRYAEAVEATGVSRRHLRPGSGRAALPLRVRRVEVRVVTEPVAFERSAVMTTRTWAEDTSTGDPGDARGSAPGQRISMTECHLPAATVEGELTDPDGLDSPAPRTGCRGGRVRQATAPP